MRKQDNTMSLFEGFDEETTSKPPKPQVVSKPIPIPAPEPLVQKPVFKPLEDTPLSYQQYLKIFCGNKAAASVWWERQIHRKDKG